MIPVEEWKYRGLKGHFINAERCRFGLCTDIGSYRISTVGAYYPTDSTPHMDMIGWQRYYETYVFNLINGKISSHQEIDSESIGFDKDKENPYDKDKEAEAMHERMCLKYAEIGFKEWMKKQ